MMTAGHEQDSQDLSQSQSRSSQDRRPMPKSWSRSHMRSIARLNQDGKCSTINTPTRISTFSLNQVSAVDFPLKSSPPRSPPSIQEEETSADVFDLTDARFKIEDEKKIGERDKIINNYFGEIGDTICKKSMEHKVSSRRVVNQQLNYAKKIQSSRRARDNRTTDRRSKTSDYSVPFIVNERDNETDSDEYTPVSESVSIPKANKTVKSNLDSLRKAPPKVDRFGFVLGISDTTHTSYARSSSNNKALIELEASRAQKWKKMMKDWDQTTSLKSQKLKRRVRKGIPNSIRGKAWALMGNVPNRIRDDKGYFYELLRQATLQQGDQVLNEGEKAQENNGVSKSGEVFKETIERDINRTFPTHSLFYLDQSKLRDSEHKSDTNKITFINTTPYTSSSEGSISTCTVDDAGPDLLNSKGGQASLRRVLRAYSVIDPEVGYCQGMNFISAMFITKMTDEEAFWLLEHVMDKAPCRMRGLFGDGMSETQEVLFIAEKVTAQFLPKLSAHFERESVHITMYATQWLLTMYSSSFPFDLVLRVWDCFLFEGWKIAYRVMLALLTLSQKDLLNLRFEELLGYLKEIHKKVDGDSVMRAAFAIPLRTTHIVKFREEYRSNQRK